MNTKTLDTDRLLSRFLHYVRIDTTARESAAGYPSSPGQLELGRLLVAELQAMGLSDAAQDEHGLVTATVPATVENSPPVAFNAHLDTSPETPGTDVKPQVIGDYAGGDLVLPGDPEKVISVEDNPDLAKLRGTTLITSDGATLLGADDKAGVAVIMETAAHLVEHPEIARGPVRILFTCDEEIGRGVDHVDIEKLGAAACYTFDGVGADEINAETFSADLAVVTVKGVNVHPSIARDRMVNAVRAAAELVGRMPRDKLSPETTAGREGFLHPYAVEGGVEKVSLRILLRDFDAAALTTQAQLLRRIADEVASEYPGAEIDVAVTRQYRNMAEGLRREPRAVEYARRAHQRLGREAKLEIVRGGTDGSRLTEMGLPAPNLSTGQHTPHSPLEWASLDQMRQAVDLLVELVQVWAEGE